MLAAGWWRKKAVERGLTRQALGEDQPRAGQPVVTEYLARRAAAVPGGPAASTWWATGAPPASATAGRCPEPIAKRPSRRGPGGGRGAQRQPQLRGAHPPAGPGRTTSPRPPLVVAYALAGPVDVDLLNEPLGTTRTAASVPARHLAQPAGGARPVARVLRPSCSTATRDVFDRRRARGGMPVPERSCTRGTRTAPTSRARRSSTTCPSTPPPLQTSRAPGAGAARRQRHHRPHLARGQYPAGLAPRAVPDRAGRATRAISTATGRGAATTR
ncbi:MAG: hypothetical protein KatS3mg021_1286 [Fimbriimonadales bacterium]|nr:MAG: hypothetical protein KatS3mg021_1286 [Fimbriimonadales bacterium]